VLTIRISRRVVFLVVLGVFLAIPAVSRASHRFTDVPDSNVFHADISWLADSGVTKGCNPPANDKFCPSNAVTREQMSAFMRRLAQYLDAEDGTPGEADNADTVDGRHASAFVLKTDLPTQGGASCAGTGFYPFTSVDSWEGSSPRTAGGAVNCPLDLPDGATMTSFTASLSDLSTTATTSCQVIRMDVTGSAFGLGTGTQDVLATTALTTGSFGDQVVTTSIIENPIVNALRYAYYASCSTSANLGVNGVVVQYTLP